MKSILALIGAFAVAALLVAGIWLGDRPVLGPNDSAANNGSDAIVNVGPPGKVAVDVSEYEFGPMVVGETGRHTFVIRNEGEGPLILRKGKTSCKCTFSQLRGGSLLSGESVEVELSWKPTQPSSEFRQSAVIHVQGDPECRELQLTVRGVVVADLETIPREEWNVGTIDEDRPTTISGVVYSTVHDSFQILEISSLLDCITGAATPLGAERLAELGAKCGYEIRATIVPRMPAGQFREWLLIRTDLPGRGPLELQIVGRRQGPVEFVPLEGTRFQSDSHTLDLGSFEARRGKSAALLMDIPAADDLRIEPIDCDPDFLDVRVTENRESRDSGRRQFRLDVAFPAGSPPLARLKENPGDVILRTNHPKLPELKLQVLFVAY